MAVVLGVVIVPITALLRVKPVWAAAGVLAVTATYWAAGLHAQSDGGLLPVIACFYALGRYSTLRPGIIMFGLFQVLLSGTADAAWTLTDAPFWLGVVRRAVDLRPVGAAPDR